MDGCIHSNNSQVIVKGVASTVPNYETIASLGAGFIGVVPKLKGGAPKPRKHITKDTAITNRHQSCVETAFEITKQITVAGSWDIDVELRGLSMQDLQLLQSFLSPADTRTPDPREDLESRSPNLGPYTTKGTL